MGIGLYKIATGEVFAKATAPGVFDLKVRCQRVEVPKICADRWKTGQSQVQFVEEALRRGFDCRTGEGAICEED
jgi:hypothetical protein